MAALAAGQLFMLLTKVHSGPGRSAHSRKARRAFREWARGAGPIWTFVKSMNNWYAAKAALNDGWQALGWMK